jgi:hypothetical protein
MTNYSLVYRPATGTSDILLYAFTQLLPANGYLLIANASATIGVVPDGTWSVGALAIAGGGVGLRDGSGTLIDAVGWGTVSSSNALIEGIPAQAPPASQSIGRIPNGVDTENNSNDFQVLSTPTPRGPNG